MKFEEALKKLEAAANSLDDEDTDLETALKNFEAGIKHYNTCTKILDDAKQRIEVYKKDAIDDERF